MRRLTFISLFICVCFVIAADKTSCEKKFKITNVDITYDFSRHDFDKLIVASASGVRTHYALTGKHDLLIVTTESDPVIEGNLLTFFGQENTEKDMINFLIQNELINKKNVRDYKFHLKGNLFFYGKKSNYRERCMERGIEIRDNFYINSQLTYNCERLNELQLPFLQINDFGEAVPLYFKSSNDFQFYLNDREINSLEQCGISLSN